MMQESLSSGLAEYLHPRMRRAGYLIPALRHALSDLGRPELAEILNLIQDDVTEARIAVEDSLAVDSQGQRLQALANLGRLSRLGGPKAKTTVHQLAARLARQSGVN